MKKSVSLKIDGKVASVVGYDGSTMVTFQIGYNPHYEKGGEPEYSYYCHGFEWGEDCYSIEFCQEEIKEGQKVELEFGVSDKPTVLAKKSIVEDEKRCSFCNKHSDDVEVLIERNLLHRICNECVEKCVKEISARNA